MCNLLKDFCFFNTFLASQVVSLLNLVFHRTIALVGVFFMEIEIFFSILKRLNSYVVPYYSCVLINLTFSLQGAVFWINNQVILVIKLNNSL